MTNDTLHPQVRLNILKQNKFELDKQLYQTDLNFRVAERLNQKDSMDKFQEDMGKTLSALDLIMDEIKKVEEEIGVQNKAT